MNELLDSMIIYKQYTKEEGKTFSFLAELFVNSFAFQMVWGIYEVPARLHFFKMSFRFWLV